MTPQEKQNKEILDMMQIPAVFANHFYFANNGETLHIAFGHMLPGTDIKIPRSAIAVTFNGAVELHNTLGKILEQVQQQQNQQKAPQAQEKEKLN